MAEPQLNIFGFFIATVIILAVFAGGVMLIPTFVNIEEVEGISIDEDAIEETWENIEELIEEASEPLNTDIVGVVIFGMVLGGMAIAVGFIWIKKSILLGLGFIGLGVGAFLLMIAIALT